MIIFHKLVDMAGEEVHFLPENTRHAAMFQHVEVDRNGSPVLVFKLIEYHNPEVADDTGKPSNTNVTGY